MKFEQVRSLPEMAAESKNEIGLEIGHVLFIDIVGYSAHSCAAPAGSNVRSAPE
jgi:hypothetical protein